jgi:hypothetical protein
MLYSLILPYNPLFFWIFGNSLLFTRLADVIHNLLVIFVSTRPQFHFNLVHNVELQCARTFDVR